MKHIIITMNLSFQKSKNILSSIKTQGKKGKYLKLIPLTKFQKNM